MMRTISLDREQCSSPLGFDASSHHQQHHDDNSTTLDGDQTTEHTSMNEPDDDASHGSQHSADSVSVVSDASDGFDNFDKAEFELDDMHDIDATSCESGEFDTSSTDDDFTYLSFVSEDDFDLEENFDEDDTEEAEVEGGKLTALEREAASLRKKQIQAQRKAKQNSSLLNHVSWHNGEDGIKRHVKTGVRRNYSWRSCKRNGTPKSMDKTLVVAQSVPACTSNSSTTKNQSAGSGWSRLSSRSLSLDNKMRV